MSSQKAQSTKIVNVGVLRPEECHLSIGAQQLQQSILIDNSPVGLFTLKSDHFRRYAPLWWLKSYSSKTFIQFE